MLMYLDKGKSAPHFCSHLFKDFEPSNVESLERFFERTVPENVDILGFFNVIFTRALLGEVSYRLFAEILGMKFSEADEFLSNKRLSLDLGVDLETQNEF
jgi:hypothetical protein